MRYSGRLDGWRRAWAVCGLLVCVAAGAAAQTGNQSDITGIPITTSSVVSPVFSVSMGGAVRVITFITPQVAQSYKEASARINAQLGSQVFADSNGVQAPPATQNLIYDVTSGGSHSAQAATQLFGILTHGNAAPETVANAEAFVQSFRGLLARGIAMDPRFFNTLVATQLANAVAAYNAYIGTSNATYLSAPPPALPVIRNILAQLTAH